MTDSFRACVIVASTRAATGVYADRSGPILAESLAQLGFTVSPVIVVPDGDPVGAALREAVGEHDVVLTSGGTGITPTDVTPQQTAPLLDYQVPQIPAEIARFGVQKGVPTALLSRGLAGVAGRALVINLPGSSGGVRDAMEVLAPILPHAVSQLRGGDH
ncbi:molybdenum cofactor biosynthesis protein [Enemella dayhoffiae]|uniref:Molybdenum cofactor biosynthesis protein n=1 Tax=Enemella dayhoffiae TaxID=2016507 RepID=A0A255HB00_9ACTN|nr:MogA/MoaB family molybdenum cofactor biosynthesis protein [Enemella dayhoffiae]OYO24526.1 molybdenum cofactor biosynthesis protein [Enemella dayhoffiae]